MLSENPEIRLEDLKALEGFKSALSLKLGNKQRSAGQLHVLALHLGVWRDGGYAPRKVLAGRIGLQRRDVGRALESSAGFMRAAKMMGVMPVYSRREGRAILDEVSGLKPMVAWPDDIARAPMKQGVPGYLTDTALKPGRRVGVSGMVRSFAPAQFSITEPRVATESEVAQPEIAVRDTARRGGERKNPPLSSRYKAGESKGVPRKVFPFLRAVSEDSAGSGTPVHGSGHGLGVDFADALDDYFFRQSRLAPAGGTAFDPRLSPLWAGLKLPA